MQTNSNKVRKHKHPLSLFEPFESLTLSASSSNHGTQQSRSSITRRGPFSSTSSSVSPSPPSSSVAGLTPSFIRKPPPEILAHIFSFLDPQGFAAASLVCREWHSIASDDYAWKAAFERFFGKHNIIPRISTTWRGEYIHRSHLLRYYQTKTPELIQKMAIRSRSYLIL
jgi:F-box-like